MLISLKMECILQFMAPLNCCQSEDNNDLVVTACAYVTLVIAVYIGITSVELGVFWG